MLEMENITDFKKIQRIIDEQYHLNEYQYISGYHAVLVAVMSGIAKVVFILKRLRKTEFEILSLNCQLASIPIFEFTSSSEEFRLPNNVLADIDVLAIKDNSS